MDYEECLKTVLEVLKDNLDDSQLSDAECQSLAEIIVNKLWGDQEGTNA